ncbi:MAG: S24 family peptidase [Lachnospiraceae bacterium]|nr:S24 family peptidase [Lachnospiraceae bacterium]
MVNSSRKTVPFDADNLRNNNILGKKITEARKQKKRSQKDLAKDFLDYHITVSSGAISKWEKGDALPNPYQLFALCQMLDIQDPLKYFTDKTPEPENYSPELSQEGLNLLRLFKETLIASGNYQAKSRRAGKSFSPGKTIPVKVFATPAAAGSGSFLTGEDYDLIEFSPSNVPEHTDFGIRITGDSMLPRYVPGQVVFVEQCRKLSPGEIGVFVYDDNAYIKQYSESAPSEEELCRYTTSEGIIKPKIDLISLNRERADCDVDVRPEHTFIIIGRVLN